MLSRRDFLQVAIATAAIAGTSSLGRLAAAQAITQDKLLEFDPTGDLTLLHFADIHAQITPVYFREPSTNLGVGMANGLPPHLTGERFLDHYGLKAGSLDAYMLTSTDYLQLARDYGQVGGLDRMATLIEAIRDARGRDNTILLGGGDMVEVMNALGVEAMTAHWEFTYGADRVLELIDQCDFPFLAGNCRDTMWEEPVFDGTRMFERAGTKVAVVGQAFPYTPIANPRYMIPDWSFGIREDVVQQQVRDARDQGAEVVVLLSHNGFDVDRKLAQRVEGIDVLFTGHTHDAIPEPEVIGNTLLIASGSHGKFLSRLDLDVQGGRIADWSYRLIPILADAIEPHPGIAQTVEKVRAPHKAELERVLGTTDSLLYRRGNFNGTWDDLICQALIAERDVQIALSPGFRWGTTLLPGQDITVEDLYTETAITYPEVYRQEMTGEQLKLIFEDVADNLFNEDPYYQQGGDMVRVGGMGYRIDVTAEMGQRISNMTLLETGEPIEPDKSYTVAGWASVSEDVEGPPVYDLVSRYIERQGTVSVEKNESIEVVGL